MITTTHHSTAHALKLPDQILLHMLVLTTIVSPVILEHIVANILCYTLMTHYGTEKDADLKIVAAKMLECHGSSVNFPQLQLEILKLGSVETKNLLMKVLQLKSYNSMCSRSIWPELLLDNCALANLTHIEKVDTYM